MMSDESASHWNGRYEQGNTPWDSGLPSAELQRVIAEFNLPPSRLLEFGCGTGTNAVYLAKQGFDVTAIDLSDLAIAEAERKAREAGADVTWLCGDVCSIEAPAVPFPVVFDRGCYHCVRRDLKVDLILKTLKRVTASGSKFILLTGNASEARDHGPPGLSESEIREELDELFEIDQLREFHFEDPGGVQGPLGWSCVATRR